MDAKYEGKLKNSVTTILYSCCSVTQSCSTLGSPTECGTPGFPVLHYLLEFAQTHVHGYDDACHSIISSSVIPFSSHLQFFRASGFFPMSQLFVSGGQSIGASASTSVLPMNTEDFRISFRMDWLDFLAVQGTLKSLLQHHSSKAS